MKIPEDIISLDPDALDFDDKTQVKALMCQLLNVIEQLVQANKELQRENQRLKDEINRLKGEKSQPRFKPNMPNKDNEIFRWKRSKEWKKSSKKPRVKIDRVEIFRVDPGILPSDAEHKGYRSVVVQNITFETCNVEYKLERYYSPGEKRVYEAELPDDVNGEFGTELMAFVVYLYFACRVPEKKIWKVLTEAGIIISEGQISNILIKAGRKEFTREKEDIFKAGMTSTDYFHIDSTGARHKSINHNIHVLCTLLFSVFFITRKRNKDTIMEILGLKDDEKIRKVMLSDDAKEFTLIAVYHALCWIHEIRHYRKMTPVIGYHYTQHKRFLTKIWKFYELLREYKEYPNEKQKRFLEQRFDELFSIRTGYNELDERIALTREKKDKLLLVLTYPWIPLHNNPAEIALRELVIKKRISYGTKSEDGKTAWENMMTLLDTCRKQGVNFLDYVEDIFSKRYSMPRLSSLILKKTIVCSTGY